MITTAAPKKVENLQFRECFFLQFVLYNHNPTQEWTLGHQNQKNDHQNVAGFALDFIKNPEILSNGFGSLSIPPNFAWVFGIAEVTSSKTPGVFGNHFILLRDVMVIFDSREMISRD